MQRHYPIASEAYIILYFPPKLPTPIPITLMTQNHIAVSCRFIVISHFLVLPIPIAMMPITNILQCVLLCYISLPRPFRLRFTYDFPPPSLPFFPFKEIFPFTESIISFQFYFKIFYKKVSFIQKK